MKHLVFIINPNSGVDRKKAVQQAIAEYLDHGQFSYEIQHTQYVKHGIELAKRAAAQGAFAVVAVGGDGSVNDVVRGLLGTETALAVIPKGSGNGMARTLSIPLNERGALELINKGNTVLMDIAYANDIPFISNAGAGFDALICERFARSRRRGLVVYSWLVTKCLWAYKEKDWDIIIDGKPTKEKAFLINAANGSQFGYNFTIAPQASWTDGLLDLIIVKKFPKMLGAVMALRMKRGTITRSPYVKHFRAKEITISHPDLKLMQTDGDPHICSNKVNFRISPAAVRVIVP